MASTWQWGSQSTSVRSLGATLDARWIFSSRWTWGNLAHMQPLSRSPGHLAPNGTTLCSVSNTRTPVALVCWCATPFPAHPQRSDWVSIMCTPLSNKLCLPQNWQHLGFQSQRGWWGRKRVTTLAFVKGLVVAPIHLENYLLTLHRFSSHTHKEVNLGFSLDLFLPRDISLESLSTDKRAFLC